MIQRIQSVYLFLVFLLSAGLFFAPISVYKNGTKNSPTAELLKYDLSGFDSTQSLPDTNFSSLYYIPLLVALIAAISLGAIFLYKKRSLQMKVCKLLMVLDIVVILMFLFFVEKEVQSVTKSKDWSATYLIGMYFPIVTLFLLYLANKAIKKDDDLVKSSDRLR